MGIARAQPILQSLVFGKTSIEGGHLVKSRALISAAILALTLPFRIPVPAGAQNMLPAPGFHHLHLNSVNPDAAIDFYTRQFPTTARTSWGGFPALKSPNNV